MLGLDGTRVLHACRKFYSEVQEDLIIMSEKKRESISMIWEMLDRMQRTGGKITATSGYGQNGNSGCRVEPQFSNEWRLESPDFAGVMKNITGVMFNVQPQIAEIRLERPKTAMI